MQRPGALASPWRVFALLLASAVALRIVDFGNPVIHVDEQYYLLVGERMLRGDIPYIDIWDRKPVGLFLLYAGAAALPGDDILGYQFLATLFAAVTAWLVWSGARRLGVAPRGAVAAAIAYLIWLPLLGGRGGQAPAFYNMFVAFAAWVTLGLPQHRRRSAIRWSGIAACLSAGLAIQIKPTAVFEGGFFGLAHLWWLWRSGERARSTVGHALLWTVAGALPSLAVIGWYWSIGAIDSWWFANIESIFGRPGYPAGMLAMRLLGIAAELLPLLICAAVAIRRRDRGDDATGLLIGWLIAAVIGFVSIGTFFDHYALPLLPPLAAMAAIVLARSERVRLIVLVFGLVLFVVERSLVPNDGPGARQLAEVVARNSHGGCPYVFIGDTITYSLADTCLPTRYAFPNFLAYTTEQGAIGIDEAAEVANIVQQRPPVIVISTRSLGIWNMDSLAVLRPALASDYRAVFTMPRAGYRSVVMLRRDLRYLPPVAATTASTAPNNAAR